MPNKPKYCPPKFDAPTSVKALYRIGLLLVLIATLIAIIKYSRKDASPSTGVITLNGTLLAVSELPKPEDSAYQDCLQVVKLQVADKSHASGSTDRLPSEILVAWSGFENRKLSPYSKLTLGTELEITALPFHQTRPEIRSMQKVDSLDDFTSPLFFATQIVVAQSPNVHPLPAPSLAAGRQGIHQKADENPARNLDRTPSQHSESRLAAIKSDRQQIARSLRTNGSDWDIWSKKLVPFYDRLRARAGENGGMLRHGGEFFSRSYDHRFGELMSVADQSPALEMIVAFDRALANQGIDLIVVPFPFKEEINAHHFDAQAPITGTLSPQRLRFIDWLLERDVEVVDLEPALRRAAETSEKLFYDYADLHPARDGIEVAAKVIAERLRRYELPQEWQQLSLKDIKFTMPESYRDRFPHLPAKAEYSARQVLTSEDKLLPENTPESPLLLVGDSFVRAPGLYEVKSSSLREHLAYLTGVLGRDLSVKGGAPQTMLNLQREGADILTGCQVCIMVFAQYPLFVDPDKIDEAEQWPIVDLQ